MKVSSPIQSRSRAIRPLVMVWAPVSTTETVQPPLLMGDSRTSPVSTETLMSLAIRW